MLTTKQLFIPTKLTRTDAFFSLLMPILALGPTIIPEIGLRSEHVSVLLFSFFALFQFRFKIKSEISWLCLIVALFFLISSFAAGLIPSFIFLKEEFNALKFFLVFTPLCCFFCKIPRNLRWVYLSRAMATYFVVVSLNFALQLANMLGYGVEISAYFAGNGEDVSLLWRACYGQGRYIGVFFQPANQGLFTGLFLICSMWVWEKSQFRWIAFAVASLSIFLGTSKAGLAALLISAVFLLRNKPLYILPLGVLTLIFISFLQWGSASGITGLELQFLNPDKENTLASLTAGRFGETSTLLYALKCVWQESPILGLGAGILAKKYAMPYDNDLIYVYATGGLFATLAEICIFFKLFSLVKGKYKYHALELAFFLSIASLGIVVFSGNGNIFLLALIISFLIAEQSKPFPR